MKKRHTLLYTSLIALFGACTVEQIDENLNETPLENLVEVSNNVCENALSAAYGYNAFIQNGVTIESGDTEGPIAMGGDLTINGSFTVATQAAGAFFHNNEELAASLVINGKVIYQQNEGINLNQGYLKIGDLTDSTVYDLDNNNVATNTRVTPGDYNDTPRILLQRNQVLESIHAPDIIDFDAAFEELNSASISFSELANNITIENGNKITLAENTLNVLNVTGEELNNLTNFTFNNQPTADSPLLINVDHNDEFVWTVQNQAGIGDQHGAFIVYNFFNSTQITIESGTTVMGSILAPSSDFIKKSSDNINGQVIAKSYVHMNGELHQHPFVYCQDTEEETCTLAIELKNEFDGEGYSIYVDTEDETLTYEWSTGDTGSSIYVFPNSTTTYTVNVTDLEGCSTTEGFTIEFPEEEVCALTVELVQEFDGEGYSIYVDTQDETLTYEWSTGDTSSSLYVFPNSTTTYTVTATDLNGCTTTESITIEFPQQEICFLTIQLVDEFDGEGYSIYVDTQDETLTYEWSTGDTRSSIYVFPFDTTTYTVNVTDLNGCTITESITIL